MSRYLDDIRAKFVNPPKSFRPMPFWFLNDDLSDEAITDSLEELAAKGIGGVFLHPRTGLQVEYLSEAYWSAIRFAVSKCAELGLEAWLYDEYNWPSGPVGGKLIRAHPEYRQRGLTYLRLPTRAGRPVSAKWRGEAIMAWGLWGDQVVNLQNALQKEGFSWTAPQDGEILIFCIAPAEEQMFVGTGAPWLPEEIPGYLDLLNAEAVSAFMEMTHREYDRRLSDFYVSTIKGVFTDEPGNYKGWPWTDSLPAKFAERYGYDLLSVLYELVWPVGNYVRTRNDYHQLALDLYVESFFAPISRWAEERGLIFTGHLMMEESVTWHPAYHGALFSPLRRMQMPGMDALGSKHGYQEVNPLLAESPNVAPKLVSSIAHASGAPRALVELWGGCGWEATLGMFKSMADWVEACGINFVNPHAVHLSLKGLRKRDFPASHFFPAPWWRYYRDFADYLARLSFVTSQGHHAADIGVLWPARSLWSEHALDTQPVSFTLIKNGLVAVTDALLYLQRDFDYIFEESLSEGQARIEDGCLVIGTDKFHTLIFPPMTLVSTAVLQLAKDLVQTGGNVFALGLLPTGSLVSPASIEHLELISDIFGPRVRRLATAKRGEWPSAQRIRALERVERVHPSGGRAIFLAWEDPLTVTAAEALLADLLRDGPEPDLRIAGANEAERRSFIYLHRVLPGKENLYFLVNLGGRGADTILDVRGEGRVECWDPVAGMVKPVHVYRVTNGRTAIPWRFEVGESAIFMISPLSEEAHAESCVDCIIHDIDKTRVRGIVTGSEPMIRVRGGPVFIHTSPTLPPLPLADLWNVTWDAPNVFRLEPWAVTLLDEERTRERRGSVWELTGVPFRSKVTATALGTASRLARRVKPPSKAVSPTIYVPMEELVARIPEYARLFGLDIANKQVYEIMEELGELATRAGLNLGQIYPPPGSAYRATTDFRLDYAPEELYLVYEDLGEPMEITLNGQLIQESTEPCYVWDHSNRCVRLTPYLVPGRNTLTYKSRMPDFPCKLPSQHSLEPMVLMGDFCIQGRTLRAPENVGRARSWDRWGRPHYSGMATYRQTFTLPEIYLPFHLVLEISDVRDTAEVWCNGRLAGRCLWPPFRLPVGHLLHAGANDITIAVTNTAENLLGRPRRSGLLGHVSIVPYAKFGVETSGKPVGQD